MELMLTDEQRERLTQEGRAMKEVTHRIFEETREELDRADAAMEKRIRGMSQEEVQQALRLMRNQG